MQITLDNILRNSSSLEFSNAHIVFSPTTRWIPEDLKNSTVQNNITGSCSLLRKRFHVIFYMKVIKNRRKETISKMKTKYLRRPLKSSNKSSPQLKDIVYVVLNQMVNIAGTERVDAGWRAGSRKLQLGQASRRSPVASSAGRGPCAPVSCVLSSSTCCSPPHGYYFSPEHYHILVSVL